ncbi:MAG: FAD-dependent oxidoreductase [Firmicutes bacterium]|nr:FAD-dependent oxidoreductase [Bacillota bacterium]
MYDVIIAGGGIAGLTAGIYAARSGLKTVIIEKEQTGGQAIFADKIENYPGFCGSGFELIEKVEAQAVDAGAEIVYDDILSLSLENDIKQAVGEENTYTGKTVILALGASHKKAGFKGEEEFAGRGVSCCAVCDGAFFKGKSAAVIGGANTAVSEALYLSDICCEVYLIYRRDRLRAEETLIKRLAQKENIKVLYNTVPIEVKGGKSVESLVTSGGEIAVNAVFTAVGFAPDTKLVKDSVALDESGFILAHGLKTNIGGVFAAGDCRKKALRQLVTAAADGAGAAALAKEFLSNT